MPGLLSWLLVHGGAAAALTWGTRRYALWRGLVDAPGERRSHAVPTPRGGGIAIVAMVLSACAWLAWRMPAHAGAIGLFAGGLLLVAAIGWVDDHRPLPARQRFVVHLVSAFLLAGALALEALPWWQVALGWLFAVCLVNIWNFMDGINGLAASQAAIAAAGYALVLPSPWAWIAWALAAACLGFLPLNFPRARIFMGDVGSGALGYVLAGLLALSLDGIDAPVLALLPIVAFSIDAGFTLLRRVLCAEAWWQPHTTHAYQRAARRLGHAPVTILCALFSIIATIAMLMLRHTGFMAGLAVTMCACLLASWIWARQQRLENPGMRNAE
jgi:UDP-N-acetylmuramyl pentapeptide phosphotransferase/UDP-N-acetylglucosamine-1-phosphate transferase